MSFRGRNSELPRKNKLSINHRLYKAIKSNDIAKFDKLLASGANPNYYVEEEGLNLIFVAFGCYRYILEKLIDHPEIDLSVTDGNNRTVLHNLIINGGEFLLSKVIDKGININLMDNYEYTPIATAIDEGSTDCILLLLKHQAEINYSDVTGLICRYNGYEMVDLFNLYFSYNNPSANDIRDMLLTSVQENNYIAYKYLLKKYPEEIKYLVNYECYNGGSIINNCDNVKIIKSLLNNGANINHKDHKGNTAIFNSTLEVAKLLLNYGIDINIQNNKGLTIIEYAKSKDNQALLNLIADHLDSALDIKQYDV